MGKLGWDVFQESGGEMFKGLREKRWVEKLGRESVPKGGWGNVPRFCVRNAGWKDLGWNVFQELGWQMFRGFAEEDQHCMHTERVKV